MTKLKPGDLFDRAAIHMEMGGRPHGHRISPSKTSDNVFIFLDPAKEEGGGSICGTTEDGAFHMVGEGPLGDHAAMRGNKVMLTHRETGRALRLFLRQHTGQYMYVGQFELDADVPFYRIDMPEEREELVIRDVYVFRLRPVGQHVPLPPSSLTRPAGAYHPREAMPPILAPKGWREKTSLEKETEELLFSYFRTLTVEGHDVVTLRAACGEGAEMVGVPLLDRTTDTVVASAGSTSRTAVRAAIGDALDYQRVSGAANTVLLLPSKPREDVLALIEHVGMTAAWPLGKGWHRKDSPAPRMG